MRNPQRTPNAGKTETIVGAGILAALVCIAVGIFVAQSRFNPAVHPLAGLPPTHLPPEITAAAPAGKALMPLPDGMAPLGPIASFTAANLSDKINGKAELYLSAGFIRLDSQRFTLPGEADLWAEAYVYDMGKPRNAYAVYSSQRRDDAEPLDVAPDAYRTANAVFMAYGSDYVEIVASGTAETTGRHLKQLLADYVRGKSVAGGDIAERNLFPEAGRIAGSIALTSSDGFGFDRLDNLFTARYSRDGMEITAFLSRRQNPRAAGELARAYAEFLMAFGGEKLPSAPGFPQAQRIEILGAFEWIFTTGSFVAGIHGAENMDLAERVAVALKTRIEEMTDGS